MQGFDSLGPDSRQHGSRGECHDERRKSAQHRPRNDGDANGVARRRRAEARVQVRGDGEPKGAQGDSCSRMPRRDSRRAAQPEVLVRDVRAKNSCTDEIRQEPPYDLDLVGAG